MFANGGNLFPFGGDFGGDFGGGFGMSNFGMGNFGIGQPQVPGLSGIQSQII